MSSARRLILIYFLSILIPFIYVSFHILFARVSKEVMNKYADNGHQCRTPLSSLKNLPVLPLFKTVDSIFLYIVFT